ASGKLGDAMAAKRSCTAVSSVLTFCPPGPAARNLSRGELAPADYAGKQLVVLRLDATWACARTMLRLSPTLQALPRIMFTPTAPSRFIIKQQPQEGCLSTLEATHETLLARCQMAAVRLARGPIARDLPALWRRAEPQGDGAYWPRVSDLDRTLDFRQPVEAMVDATVATLLGQIEGDSEPHHHRIDGPLVIRRSARLPEGYRP
ncbi:MAG: DTW domain-containing protein, partial [Rhabdaerophilum sp.]